MITEEVILVNEKDEQVGVMEKMEAHRQALLHRAFSIFIFNDHGEMLLQQRAFSKYHSPGLWSNACCSHPRPGEETKDAAQRRVTEELGIDMPLEKQFHFMYRATFENGLTEHEFDHVFTGHYNQYPVINKSEVNDCCYQSMAEIKHSLIIQPGKFTEWFKIVFPEIENWWNKNYNNAAA